MTRDSHSIFINLDKLLSARFKSDLLHSLFYQLKTIF